MNYDVTIQWKDTSRAPGYQAVSEDLVVCAESFAAAIVAARAMRPNVSRVQVQGIAGTGIAFDGVSWAAS
jgi:hypothetical protein